MSIKQQNCVPLAPLDHVGWLAEQPEAFREWMSQTARWHPGHAAITQEELAKLVGMTRTTIRHVLTQLVDNGAVEIGYRKIVIRNRDELARLQDEQ